MSKYKSLIISLLFFTLLISTDIYSNTNKGVDVTGAGVDKKTGTGKGSGLGLNLHKSSVVIPDQSFKGEELKGFRVQPSFSSVDYNVDVPNMMDTYIRKSKIEFNVGDNTNYDSDEPGFMYSGSFKTSVSSLFVGELAYRNNIVKSYLNKNHIEVTNSYEKYKEKLDKSVYSDESKLLYGLSLYNTSSHSKAFKILSELSAKEGLFKDTAMDSFFQIADNSNKLSVIENSGRKIDKFTPYSLSKWLKFLSSKGEYKEMSSLVDKHVDYTRKYPKFNEMKAFALYNQKRYSDVIQMGSLLESTNSYILIVDSQIMTGNIPEAKKYIGRITDENSKNFLEIKILIAENKYDEVIKRIHEIKTDDEKLSILSYLVSNNFEAVPIELISSFKFKNKRFNDYTNFFTGIKYLMNNDNYEAIRSFSLLTFDKELLQMSYFYQGIATATLDPNRAKFILNKYITTSKDQEKIGISKYILAQIEFLNGNSDGALKLIAGCDTGYCKVLRGDVYLSAQDYHQAIISVKGVKDDNAALIRAAAYYNLQDYKKAITEIESMAKQSDDSKYILVSSHFKLNNNEDALNIVKNSGSSDSILSLTAMELILAGDSENALKVIDKIAKPTPEILAEKAKLLASKGMYLESRKIYEDLIDSKELLYRSYDGLYQIALIDNDTDYFYKSAYDTLSKGEPFDKEDKLLLDMSKSLLDAGKINTAKQYSDLFNKKYPTTGYRYDALLVRARIASSDNRYLDCLENLDNAKAEIGKDNDDLLFVRAECLESSKRNESLDLYKGLAVNKNRYHQLSTRKIVQLSTNANEILDYSQRIKPYSFDIYKEGMTRFMAISNEKEYQRNIDLIKYLSNTATDDIRLVATKRIARSSYEARNYEQAAYSYMKAYYLFATDKDKLEILSGAKDSFDALNKKEESEKILLMMKGA